MNDAASTTATGAVHLDMAQFKHTLSTAGDKPVLVDFYADWCGPCKLAAPIIDKLADEFRDQITIAKVNVDEQNQLAGEHGVMSIPTVIVFHHNEEVDRKIGFPGEDGYRQMINQALADQAAKK